MLALSQSVGREEVGVTRQVQMVLAQVCGVDADQPLAVTYSAAHTGSSVGNELTVNGNHLSRDGRDP